MRNCIDWLGVREANEDCLRGEHISLQTLQQCILVRGEFIQSGHFVKKSLLGTAQSVADYASGNNVPSLLFDGRRVACQLPTLTVVAAASRANSLRQCVRCLRAFKLSYRNGMTERGLPSGVMKAVVCSHIHVLF